MSKVRKISVATVAMAVVLAGCVGKEKVSTEILMGKWEAEPFKLPGFELQMPIARVVEIGNADVVLDGRRVPLASIHVDKENNDATIYGQDLPVGITLHYVSKDQLTWSPLAVFTITYNRVK